MNLYNWLLCALSATMVLSCSPSESSQLEGTSVVPPSNVHDVHTFLDWTNHRKSVAYIIHSTTGVEYMIEGRLESWMSSGPAMYCFDSQGNMTEWVRDSGEGVFWDRKRIRGRIDSIAIAEILAGIER